MSCFIGCCCKQYDPTCPVCRAGKAAYDAGRRAYRQGRSSHTKHGHHGFEYRWTKGWDDARNANPNTAARRAKERAARNAEEAKRLQCERAEIDRRLKELSV